jgi:hypothetical protein
MPSISALVARDRKALDVIDIVEMPASKPAALTMPEAPAPDAPRPSEPSRPQPEARNDARAVTPVPSPPGPATAEPQAPPAPGGTPNPGKFDELPPEAPGGVLGLPGLGGPAWSIPGVVPGPGAAPAPAPTVAPAPRPVDRNIAGIVIGAELAKNDKALGLDLPMAGSMSSSVRTAVMGTELPAGTSGSIECRVTAAGRVTGCKMVGSNGGSPGAWDVAVRAASAVAGGALSGRYANGAVVTIDVNVSQGPPAGGKGGISGAGATFDISNIGAHATRNVRATHRVVAAR